MDDTLEGHARRLAAADLRRLFATQPERARTLALDWGDWRIDVSKERLDPAALDALLAHARAIDLPRWIDAQFAGERLNLSERRAALHTALRQQDDAPVRVDGDDVLPAVRATQARMRDFATRLRSGAWTGATGRST